MRPVMVLHVDLVLTALVLGVFFAIYLAHMAWEKYIPYQTRDAIWWNLVAVVVVLFILSIGYELVTTGSISAFHDGSP